MSVGATFTEPTTDSMAPSITDQNVQLHLTSSHSIPALLAFLVTPFVLYYIGNIVWTTFFDPLSHVPGPKLWVAFRRILETEDIIDVSMDEEDGSIFYKVGSLLSCLRQDPGGGGEGRMTKNAHAGLGDSVQLVPHHSLDQPHRGQA